MVIHVISTINGEKNEGMRNVATHLSKEFEKENTVLYSGLKQFFSIIVNTCKADVTIVFARANKLVYELLRIVTKFNSNVWIVLVQKPDKSFIRKNEKNTLKCNYFYIYEEDLNEIKQLPENKCQKISVGIDKEKFVPITFQKKNELKKKYGYELEVPLIVHVGHCSAGRGLEDFVKIRNAQKLVVASGMFEDSDVVNVLQKANVDVFKGYLENIQEIYQMSDAYFFPTRSAEFVISVPLSVMEALSCGIPVIGYNSFNNLREISSINDSIILVDDAEEINHILKEIEKKRAEHSLLKCSESWKTIAENVLKTLEEEKNEASNDKLHGTGWFR